jgi:hypothetical protein
MPCRVRRARQFQHRNCFYLNKNRSPSKFLMKTLSKILVTLVGAVWLISTASANLVVNPGFETGNFTGWTQSGNTSFSGVSGGVAHSGSFEAFFGPLTLGFLSQDLATVASATYDLTFWLRNDQDALPPNFLNHFEASWNGSVISTSVLDNVDAFDYTQFTFTGLLATGSSTALQFGFENDRGFWDFDDVSVTLNTAPSGVPEAFSTLWLALPLAGMLGFSLLRRRVEV